MTLSVRLCVTFSIQRNKESNVYCSLLNPYTSISLYVSILLRTRHVYGHLIPPNICHFMQWLYVIENALKKRPCWKLPCFLFATRLTCEGTSLPTFWSFPTRFCQLKFAVWRPLKTSFEILSVLFKILLKDSIQRLLKLLLQIRISFILWTIWLYLILARCSCSWGYFTQFTWRSMSGYYLKLKLKLKLFLIINT